MSKNESFLVEKTQIMTPDYWKQLFDIQKGLFIFATLYC